MKLPPIAEKLAPAQAILDVINRNIRITEWSCYPDEIECEATFIGEETPEDLTLSGLVTDAWAEASRLLPDEYAVVVADEKFSIVRLTPEQMAELQEATEDEPAEEGVKIPFCYRLEPEAMAHFDDAGQPVPFYGHMMMWFLSDPTPTRLDEVRSSFLEMVAKQCACGTEHVTHISVEEYLAAGNSLED